MLKLSYSSISNYLQCPRKFKEVNVDYRFTDGTFATQKGEDMHKKIEEYILGLSDTPPVEGHQVIENLRAMANLDMPFGCSAGVEQLFAVDINGNKVEYKSPDAVLRGKIDAYVITPSRMVVFDWKTGKRRDNRMQATAYEILAGGLAPDRPHDFIFDYLKDGRDPAIQISKEDKENFWKIIKTIQGADVFPEKPSPLCAWCPVPKAFCKFKKE